MSEPSSGDLPAGAVLNQASPGHVPEWVAPFWAWAAGWCSPMNRGGNLCARTGAKRRLRDNYPAARLQAAMAGDPVARQEWEGIKAVQRGDSAQFEMDFATRREMGRIGFRCASPRRLMATADCC